MFRVNILVDITIMANALVSLAHLSTGHLGQTPRHVDHHKNIGF